MALVTVTRSASWAVRKAVTVTRSASWAVRKAVTLTRAAYWSVVPAWSIEPVCPVLAHSSDVFRRVIVDYLVEGAARVSWELDRHFVEPTVTTYVYQLQASPGAVDTADDWVDVGGPVTDAFALLDDRKRLYGKSADLCYRVLLTTDVATYVSPVAEVLGKLDEYSYLLIQECVRKELLRHRLFGSVQGWLLKARRFGEVCDCVDSLTNQVTDSSHERCFSTGIVSGYYKAVPCQFATIEPSESREQRDLSAVGTEKKMVTTGRFVGFPLPVQGDAFVSSGGDTRFYIHSVRELACWRQCVVIVSCELRLAPFSDILYKVPIQ
jgi:hypothetical protein